MHLTDEEIRQILLKEKRKKRRKKKLIRRAIALLVLILIVALGIGLFANRHLRKRREWTKPGLERGIIFLDPGHGGGDPGAEFGKRKEKDDTLRIAKLVKNHLEEKGFTVYLSRDKDVWVERDERSKMANKYTADLMLSIHRNRAVEGRGVETWIQSTDPADSRLLAENLLKYVSKVHDMPARKVGVGTVADPTDDYVENSLSKMPSCIIELGFVTDKTDNALFDKYLDEYAKAVADAIEVTYKELYEKDKDKKK